MQPLKYCANCGLLFVRHIGDFYVCPDAPLNSRTKHFQVFRNVDTPPVDSTTEERLANLEADLEGGGVTFNNSAVRWLLQLVRSLQKQQK